jgi:hypothetical protein
MEESCNNRLISASLVFHASCFASVTTKHIIVHTHFGILWSTDNSNTIWESTVEGDREHPNMRDSRVPDERRVLGVGVKM